ncbi:hypothetical protein CQW23_16960 [Capsicum baccatum]|uniref:DUF4216 domain-containing protein n=1 Tax=Capsicum baccatum TaxID=33114 RepID=A0A2G2WCF3_CAPBA|nr:hypothetical protein CQW23_16960 [Capsicum baccatum]
MTHLRNNGFVPNYNYWHYHGEIYIPDPSVLDIHQENLCRYKNDVKNKNKVEASTLAEEASLFCVNYFKSHILRRHRKVPQNLDGGGFEEDHPEMLSIIRKLVGVLAWDPSSDITNQIMKYLIEGPLHMVHPFNGYVINSYKFCTREYSSKKSMMNSSVRIKGCSHSDDIIDYFGRLIEILQLEYNALPFNQTMLFKCYWFDPTPKHGTRVDLWYNVVDVNKRRFFNIYKPFTFVVQASQVYFEMYPTVKKTMSEWLAVFSIKARSIADVPKKVEQPHTLIDPAFQEDYSQIHQIDIVENKILNILNDPDSILIDMKKEEEKEEDGREEDKNDEKDEDEDENKDEDNDEDADLIFEYL